MRRGLLVLGLAACTDLSGLASSQGDGDAGDAATAADSAPSLDAASDGASDGSTGSDAGDASDGGDGGDGGTTRLRNITFEDGLLYHPLTGASGGSGSPMVTGTNPLKGAVSLLIPNGPAAFVSDDLQRDEVYISMYMKVSAPVGVYRVLNVTGSTLAMFLVGLTLAADGLHLRTSLQLGVSASPVLAGQVYRVGLHVNRNGVIKSEAFIASGNAAFGAPFATSTDPIGVTPANFQVGRPDDSGPDLVFDDIRIDTSSMPGPSP